MEVKQAILKRLSFDSEALVSRVSKLLKLENRKIGGKIRVVATAGCIGLVAIFLFFTATSIQNNHRLSLIAQEYYPVLENTDSAISLVELIEPELYKAHEDISSLSSAEQFVTIISGLLETILEISPRQEDAVTELALMIRAFGDEISSTLQASESQQAIDLEDRLYGLEDRVFDLEDAFDEFRSVNYETFTIALETAQSSSINAIVATLIILLVIMVIVSLIGLVVSRLMSANIQRLSEFASKVAKVDLESTIEFNSQDEIGDLSASLLEMQNELKNRIEADREKAKEVQLAVDETVRVFGSLASGDLTQTIDNEYKDAFKVLKNDANATVEKLSEVIEKDIQAIVQAALQGDLSKRIDLTGKEGFFRTLSAGVNDLVSISESVVNEVGGLLSSMSAGDLSTRINADFRGQFEVLKLDANSTSEKLADVIENDIQHIVDAAREGDLSQRIELDGKHGFFLTLSEGVNNLVEVCDQVTLDTVRVLSALSMGDLSQKIEREYQGSFEKLKHDANATIEKLHEVVTDIRHSSDSVATGADELAQGNLNLSQRTEEQASSLEETASSMEEMTSSVNQNASNAVKADDLAKNAREKAEHGGEVVNKAVNAMAEINQASERIADIISVIDEIAFQTNLLALNASVEAARAGEQGRGFAVVASEVRNLAGRSATAAKEIKDLIEDSVNKVSEGSKLVDESGKVLEEIVSSVQQVTSIVGDISVASGQQASGIAEVNASISQMDEMTQQNAALVEEAAAASESMGDQAQELAKLIGFFSTDNKYSQS